MVVATLYVFRDLPESLAAEVQTRLRDSVVPGLNPVVADPRSI